jgi:hypothetical protein
VYTSINMQGLLWGNYLRAVKAGNTPIEDKRAIPRQLYVFSVLGIMGTSETVFKNILT